MNVFSRVFESNGTFRFHLIDKFQQEGYIGILIYFGCIVLRICQSEKRFSLNVVVCYR